MKKIVYLLLPIGIAFFGFQTYKISQIKQIYRSNIQQMKFVMLEMENTNLKLQKEIDNLILTYFNLIEGKESHQLCKMMINVPLLKKSPKIIKKVMPDADWLRYARVDGYVYIEVIIDSEGNVIRLRVIHGIELLNKYAIRAVLQWKFMPAIIDGKTSPARFLVRIRFSYNDYNYWETIQSTLPRIRFRLM